MTEGKLMVIEMRLERTIVGALSSSGRDTARFCEVECVDKTWLTRGVRSRKEGLS